MFESNDTRRVDAYATSQLSSKNRGRYQFGKFGNVSSIIEPKIDDRVECVSIRQVAYQDGDDDNLSIFERKFGNKLALVFVVGYSNYVVLCKLFVEYCTDYGNSDVSYNYKCETLCSYKCIDKDEGKHVQISALMYHSSQDLVYAGFQNGVVLCLSIEGSSKDENLEIVEIGRCFVGNGCASISHICVTSTVAAVTFMNTCTLFDTYLQCEVSQHVPFYWPITWIKVAFGKNKNAFGFWVSALHNAWDIIPISSDAKVEAYTASLSLEPFNRDQGHIGMCYDSNHLMTVSTGLLVGSKESTRENQSLVSLSKNQMLINIALNPIIPFGCILDKLFMHELMYDLCFSSTNEKTSNSIINFTSFPLFVLYCVKSLKVNSLIEYCETSIAIVLAQKEEKGDCNAGSSYYLCDLLDELQEVGTDEFTTARNLVKTEVEDDDNEDDDGDDDEIEDGVPENDLSSSSSLSSAAASRRIDLSLYQTKCLDSSTAIAVTLDCMLSSAVQFISNLYKIQGEVSNDWISNDDVYMHHVDVRSMDTFSSLLSPRIRTSIQTRTFIDDVHVGGVGFVAVRIYRSQMRLWQMLHVTIISCSRVNDSSNYLQNFGSWINSLKTSIQFLKCFDILIRASIFFSALNAAAYNTCSVFYDASLKCLLSKCICYIQDNMKYVVTVDVESIENVCNQVITCITNSLHIKISNAEIETNDSSSRGFECICGANVCAKDIFDFAKENCCNVCNRMLRFCCLSYHFLDGEDDKYLSALVCPVCECEAFSSFSMYPSAFFVSKPVSNVGMDEDMEMAVNMDMDMDMDMDMCRSDAGASKQENEKEFQNNLNEKGLAKVCAELSYGCKIGSSYSHTCPFCNVNMIPGF